jgi:protein-S-isoprenylcysteine O-methyltransferase Ste14
MMKPDGTATQRVRDNSGVSFPPPLIYAGLLVVGFILQFFWPLRIVDPIHNLVTRATGAVLILLGLALMATALDVFRSVGTSPIPVKPTTALAFQGPYRFTRNPMYLAMLLVSSGIGLVANALWPVLMLPVMLIIVDRTVIRREERYLATKFGEPYTTYLSQVRRWI